MLYLRKSSCRDGLLLALVLLGTLCAKGVVGRLLNVTDESSFVAALQNPDVSRVVLKQDIFMSAKARTPVFLRRNVTVTGFGDGKPPYLDFNNAKGLIQMDSDTVLILRRLELSRPSLSSLAYDFIGFSPGATLMIVDCILSWNVGPPVETALLAVTKTPRPTGYPGMQKVRCNSIVNVQARLAMGSHKCQCLLQLLEIALSHYVLHGCSIPVAHGPVHSLLHCCQSFACMHGAQVSMILSTSSWCCISGTAQ